MKSFSPILRRAFPVLAGLVTCAVSLHAQTGGGARPSGSTGSMSARPPTTVNSSSRSVGGGGSSGSSAGANRQYTNSTMVGEATITSDLQTRRLIVVTDDETNENIRNIIQTLDKPKPQVLINVVFVQVTHDKGVDLGAEAVFNGTIAIKNEPRGIATTKFGVAEALTDATQFGAFYRILSQDVNATLRALSSVSK
ncbi:MAG: hypothetical protein ACKPB0_02360, partial [Opitutaceae bacterium]